jgi:hypothetical protein
VEACKRLYVYTHSDPLQLHHLYAYLVHRFTSSFLRLIVRTFLGIFKFLCYGSGTFWHSRA